MDDHNAAVDYVERLDVVEWLDEIAMHGGSVVAWALEESECVDISAGLLVRGAVARLRRIAEEAERTLEQLSGNSGQLNRPRTLRLVKNYDGTWRSWFLKRRSSSSLQNNAPHHGARKEKL